VDEQVIGVISDTHGLLRPQVIERFAGVARILHAGDIGDPAILGALEALAPVVAVRGNVDLHAPLRGLAPSEIVELAGALVYLVHSPFDIDIDPVKAGVAAIVYGHTHRPRIETKDGVLYLNPGSAGPRRPASEPSAALLRVRGKTLEAELVDL
jgi:putative phosphoesterase